MPLSRTSSSLWRYEAPQLDCGSLVDFSLTLPRGTGQSFVICCEFANWVVSSMLYEILGYHSGLSFVGCYTVSTVNSYLRFGGARCLWNVGGRFMIRNGVTSVKTSHKLQDVSVDLVHFCYGLKPWRRRQMLLKAVELYACALDFSVWCFNWGVLI
jgi:hypothetical protein